MLTLDKAKQLLAMEVRDVAAICIEAMKAYAAELQLGPKE